MTETPTPNVEVKPQVQEQPEVVKQAMAAAELLRLANAEKERLLKLEEEMMARRALGGMSTNSNFTNTPAETEAERLIRESNMFLKGTGLKIE